MISTFVTKIFFRSLLKTQSPQRAFKNLDSHPVNPGRLKDLADFVFESNNLMTQVDRRIRRSKKLLGQALIDLTLEKSYEEITILDITDRADIGYRTFFRHYADKDELLKDVLANTIVELRELLGPPSPELFFNPQVDILEQTYSVILFEHIQKHSDLYRVLLRSERSVIESLIAFAIGEFKVNFGPLTQSDIPAGIVANHLVSSTFAIVRWWLDQDMPYTPEKMGEYHARLIVKPLREMILKSAIKENLSA